MDAGNRQAFWVLWRLHLTRTPCEQEVYAQTQWTRMAATIPGQASESPPWRCWRPVLWAGLPGCYNLTVKYSHTGRCLSSSPAGGPVQRGRRTGTWGPAGKWGGGPNVLYNSAPVTTKVFSASRLLRHCGYHLTALLSPSPSRPRWTRSPKYDPEQ